jgi:DNA polymerase-3 subunit alpha
VQPIIGCQVDLAYDPAARASAPKPPAPVVLLAQNEAGYENLMKLNSCLYLRQGGGQLPRSRWTSWPRMREGLICLTGGPDGPVGRLCSRAAPAARR